MYQVIIVVHVLLGLGIVGLVLMQQGKGADAGAAFGSGSSGSVFGAQGSASFLSRTTAIFATLFFTTSLTLAALSGKQVKHVDIMDTVETPAHSVDVPAASKTPVPAVSAVTDKPAAILPAITTPVVKAEVPAPAVVDNAAKVDENKKVAEQKTTEKKQDSDKSGKAKAKNDKKSSDKSEKKADKAKKHKSDKKDKASDKK